MAEKKFQDDESADEEQMHSNKTADESARKGTDRKSRKIHQERDDIEVDEEQEEVDEKERQNIIDNYYTKIDYNGFLADMDKKNQKVICDYLGENKIIFKSSGEKNQIISEGLNDNIIFSLR
jgi:hypothetical protein